MNTMINVDIILTIKILNLPKANIAQGNWQGCESDPPPPHVLLKKL